MRIEEVEEHLRQIFTDLGKALNITYDVTTWYSGAIVISKNLQGYEWETIGVAEDIDEAMKTFEKEYLKYRNVLEGTENEHR